MKIELKIALIFFAAVSLGAFSGCRTTPQPKLPIPGPNICDSVTQPASHYGMKRGSCYPSCGVLGGQAVYGPDCGGLREEIAYDVDHCCIPATTTTTTLEPVYPKRKGKVRISGKSLRDDDGEFVALGASMFWATWGFKNDRAMLERNLKFLADSGFDYIRVLGTVGALPWWEGRVADWRWPDYGAVISGLTDLAYDKYGLRIEWTLIGDGQVMIPNEQDRYKLVDKFVAMSKGREHKIMHFEIANEAWQNGFAGDAGNIQLNKLTKYMNDKTDIPVAASAPPDVESAKVIYANGVADIGTFHFDRDIHKCEGSWRPVRQPWEYQFEAHLPKVGSNNEPIGPGASVNTESDPMKLVMGALVTYVSGLSLYVYHASPGVMGRDEFVNKFTAQTWAFKTIHKYLPSNISNWTPQNGHWDTHPFEQIGTMACPPATGSGAVRHYGAVSGNKFFTIPMGINDYFDIKARRPMRIQVINPLTGEILEGKILTAGETLRLKGLSAYVIKGEWL